MSFNPREWLYRRKGTYQHSVLNRHRDEKE